MTTLIDTTVWIDFFRGVETPEVALLEAVVRQGQAALGDLILCEVLQGIREERDFKRVRQQFEPFPVLPMVGVQIAVQSAINFRRLRAKGITVRKTIDCLIATFCIESDVELLHHDRDFDPFEREFGLRVLRHPD